MEITRYRPRDRAALFALMEAEGAEWSCYWQQNRARYEKALAGSATFLAWDGTALVGFARCRHDDGFGIYVYDLLVDKACRGRGIGNALMQAGKAAFPNEPAYVMSDVDTYYEKQGYRREGSIFEIL